MLDHLSIQCQDVEVSASFYDAVLAPLGSARIMDFTAAFGHAIGYGAAGKPSFWLGPLSAGQTNRDPRGLRRP